VRVRGGETLESSNGKQVGHALSITGHVLGAATTLEAGLITLFTWGLALIVPTICLLGLIDFSDRARQGLAPGSAFGLWTAVAALVGSSALGLFCVAATARAFNLRERPFGPAAALRQWRLPIPLRVIPSAWWLAHFLLGAAFAAGMEHFTPRTAFQTQLLIAALAFILTSAANLHLLLAISALGHFPRAIHALWSWRFLIDLVVALVPIVLMP